MKSVALRGLALVCLLVSLTLPGFSGGEIPWPQSLQSELHPSLVRGLWILPGEKGQNSYYLNIEVFNENAESFDVLISQLSFPDFVPVRQGRLTIFSTGPNRPGFLEQDFESTQGDEGAYIFMRGFFEEERDIYLRLVELKFKNWGVMGASLLSKSTSDLSDHRFAFRSSKGLVCTIGSRLGIKKDETRVPFQCITQEELESQSNPRLGGSQGDLK